MAEVLFVDWLENIENPLRIASPAVAHFSARYDVMRFKPSNTWHLAAILPESLEKAVPQRQAEFFAGRYCASRAMAQLIPGRTDIVAMAKDRSPQWPMHLIGSITHSFGFVSAAVALRNEIAALGIDCERVLTTQECVEIEEAICTKHELDFLHETSGPHNRAEILTLIFSGKESVYKCLYPIAQCFIEFQDVELSGIDAARGALTFVTLVDIHPQFPRGTKIEGIFKVQEDNVHTAVYVQT